MQNFSVQGMLLFLIMILAISPQISTAQDEQNTWPRRVLITNDDGIEENRLEFLAKAFAQVAETYVFASIYDRSGSGSYTSIGKYQRALEATKVHSSPNLQMYAVNGFPADCVLVGLLGVLKDDLPDIVISGINGGTNEGTGWFGSGTIGAVRMAAYGGIPAIAFSGLDDDDEQAVKATNAWAVRLAQSSIARNLKPGQYLTVSFPRISPDQIKGVRVAARASHLMDYSFVKADSMGENEVWVLQISSNMRSPAKGTDVDLLRQGYIVIVPMSVDEHDYELIDQLKQRMTDIPDWNPNP